MSIVEVIIKTIDQSKGSLTGLTSNLGNLALKYISVGAVAGAAAKVIGDSVKTTLDYADSVRKLSMISGESTENTSRFLQVIDDYKLSASDALAATRALTREGHTPSIETLARLSDEYLSINDAQARNEFVIKNLGRAGLQWVEVLNKGSEALLAQGDAVSESLILSQKQVDAARKNEIAVDNWNDAVQGLKISIGNQLLPVMTDFINGMNEGQRAAEILQENGLGPVHMGSQEYRDALKQAHEEQVKSTEAMLEQADAAEQNAEAIRVDEEAIKALSEANQEYLGLVGSLTGELDNHHKTLEQIKEDQVSLLAEKQNLIDQGYSVEGEKISEVNAKIEENQKKYDEAEVAFQKASRSRILAMLEQQLALDGLNEKETDYLLNLGLKWGVYSAEAVTAAQEAMAEVANLKSELDSIPEEKHVNIYVSTIGGYEYGTSGYNNIAYAGRAAGGPVSAGMPYTVGERGPETFVPSQSGSIVPNGGGMVDYKKMAREIRNALAQAGG